MAYSIKTIFSGVLKEYQNLDDVQRVAGYPNLLSTDLFVDEFWDLVDEMNEESNVKKKGRPSTTDPSILALLELISRLYIHNGVEFSEEKKRSTRTCLSQSLVLGQKEDGYKMNAFFSYQPSHTPHWVNVLSALHLEYGILNTEQGTFEEFLQKYIDCLSQINISATEVFYPRQLTDVCAAYTIYIHQTGDYFDKLYQELYQIVDEHQKAERKKADEGTFMVKKLVIKVLSGEFLENVSKDPNTIIENLKTFIRQYPDAFLPARHYSLISTLLQAVQGQNQDVDYYLECSNFVTLFEDQKPRYEEKDEQLEEFYYELYDKLFSKITNEDVEQSLIKYLFGMLPKTRPSNDEEESTLSLEYIAENIISSLRVLFIMLLFMRHANSYSMQRATKENFERFKEGFESEVEEELQKMGLPILQITNSKAYTMGDYRSKELREGQQYNPSASIDYCLSKYLQNTFLEIGKRAQ